MRKFRNEGHQVYIVSPVERQYGLPTELKEVDGVHILNVKTLNVQKTNIIEKGISTLLLESQFKWAIQKYLKNIHFDLILYSTPPITFNKVIEYLKQKNPNAVRYLLLKDIFPQNAVDLGMFSKKSILYKIFRKKEIRLYKNSDYIGCMSPANINFVLKHNYFVRQEQVELAPNSIELRNSELDYDRNTIRLKYNLPLNKPIFIYGGNLGRPQGIDFLMKCLDANKNRTDCHFLIVGNGTEFHKLDFWFRRLNTNSISLFSRLPKEDYDLLVRSCDVGLIFLDHRFTIPNFPSRLLSYLEYKMPIIAATDVNTDIGRIAVSNSFGQWCESIKVEDFNKCVDLYVHNPMLIREFGENGYQYLLDNYQIRNTYDVIIKHFK